MKTWGVFLPISFYLMITASDNKVDILRKIILLSFFFGKPDMFSKG